MATNKLRAARQLLLQESFGVLSTISVDVPGYPFGSVTPYCVDRDCQPIVYISTIAQHTRNIIANPKVSLTVVEANSDSDDVQARGRLTLLADARPVDPANTEIRDRYLRYFPSAVQYDGTHDFGFYRLVTRAGSIHRRIRSDLLADAGRTLPEESVLIPGGIRHRPAYEQRPCHSTRSNGRLRYRRPHNDDRH